MTIRSNICHLNVSFEPISFIKGLRLPLRGMQLVAAPSVVGLFVATAGRAPMRMPSEADGPLLDHFPTALALGATGDSAP
jgi:hypothetical protein